MNKKKPFVLRLQPDMMQALEKWAADDFRSVNGQIEWIINRTLKEAGRMKSSNDQHQQDMQKNRLHGTGD